MTHSTETERKAAFRRKVRARRALLNPEQRNDDAVNFAETGQALLDSLGFGPSRISITGYLPVGSEPPILALLEVFSSAGHQVFMPVCEPDRELSWVSWDPDSELRTSKFAAIQEPVGTRNGFEVLSSVGLMLLPALAVDAAGTRLGQGGGYYDRLLARLRQQAPNQLPAIAAVVYSEDLLPGGTLPREELDQPVQFALTPDFFRRLEC